ncbi:MAG: glutamate racemase [Anaerolineales bacterium]
MTSKQSAPIGAFDSGVGGLSVLKEIRAQLPNENIIYIADQANVPYGPKGLEKVRQFSDGITQFLFAQGAKLIVIPCNTASAAALHYLREKYPDVPFVGMEPAVKPAAEQTETGVIGVLATPTTFEGELYASVVERFAQDATVLQSTCPGLVAEIEAGRANGPTAKEILEDVLRPMLKMGLDIVVLGCTHYPFSFETIRDIVGPKVKLIDPAPAIALRTASLLDQKGLRNSSESAGNTRYFTSRDPVQMKLRVQELLGENDDVAGLSWLDGRLVKN